LAKTDPQADVRTAASAAGRGSKTCAFPNGRALTVGTQLLLSGTYTGLAIKYVLVRGGALAAVHVVGDELGLRSVGHYARVAVKGWSKACRNAGAP